MSKKITQILCERCCGEGYLGDGWFCNECGGDGFITEEVQEEE
jgi:TM2 domain-containing membrane protein YozV